VRLSTAARRSDERAAAGPACVFGCNDYVIHFGSLISAPKCDDDGLPDLWEVETGLDPRSATGANGATGDPDDDELTNHANGATGDPDDDELTNHEEYGWKTDP
jgi:hypothetical protein